MILCFYTYFPACFTLRNLSLPLFSVQGRLYSGTYKYVKLHLSMFVHRYARIEGVVNKTIMYLHFDRNDESEDNGNAQKRINHVLLEVGSVF